MSDMAQHGSSVNPNAHGLEVDTGATRGVCVCGGGVRDVRGTPQFVATHATSRTYRWK